MKKPFFISTAIPYVNAKPHLGFALEIVQADIIARYRRVKGEDVFFLTGTDENALKNVLAAQEEGISTQELVSRNAQAFRDLKEALNLSWDDFIRTTEPRHLKGAEKFWLAAERDIYKKAYRGLYCVGCEEFKTLKDLVDEHCPEHPGAPIESVEEENYFFRLSSYQDVLEKLIRTDQLQVTPEARKNEVLSFIQQGLQDFSISRSRERARNWGVPVPGDETQIQYVWFDALTNYITALGYAEGSGQFKRFWQENNSIVHVIGKGVIRFHAIYWPAMLLSAGLNLPRQIVAHGYLTVGGQKISKSLGNVVDPFEVVAKYGTDALRYWLARDMSPFEDGDFTWEKFGERYNADLANGLGNFVSRVLTLAERLNGKKIDFEKDVDPALAAAIARAKGAATAKLAEYRFHEALAAIWELIGAGDRYVNEKKPWAVPDEKVLFSLVTVVDNVAALLTPFLPGTSELITKCITWSDHEIHVSRGPALFPRIP
ncbi:MAG: methionine--tRNA ligase [Candidatus Jorgensenbacteria bacterium]